MAPSYTNDMLLGNLIQGKDVVYIAMYTVYTEVAEGKINLCIDSGSIELGGLFVRNSITEMYG